MTTQREEPTPGYDKAECGNDLVLRTVAQCSVHGYQACEPNRITDEAAGNLDVDRWNEAMFRIGVGMRQGDPALLWAMAHQQEWAQWLHRAMPQVIAEYKRMGKV